MIELGLQFEKGASERKEIETKLLREVVELITSEILHR
jgi:hypothetical protein